MHRRLQDPLSAQVRGRLHQPPDVASLRFSAAVRAHSLPGRRFGFILYRAIESRSDRGRSRHARRCHDCRAFVSSCIESRWIISLLAEQIDEIMSASTLVLAFDETIHVARCALEEEHLNTYQLPPSSKYENFSTTPQQRTAHQRRHSANSRHLGNPV